MLHDVWFARDRAGKMLWFAWAEPGQPPHTFPESALSVREAFAWLKKAGIRVGQVGIADRGMLGLE